MGPRPRRVPGAPTGLTAHAGRLDADDLDAALAVARPSHALPRVRRSRVTSGQRAAAVVATLYVLTGTVLWLATPAPAGRDVVATTRARGVSGAPGATQAQRTEPR